MNENKEIEEMARKICMYYIEGNCTVDKQPCNCDCANYLYAKKFYRVGYRNCKDKVVLSKEEYEELRRERSDYITELQETHNENCRLRIELEDIRKETAREILKALKNMAYRSNDWSHGTHPMVVEVDSIEEIAEKYGVDE